MKASMYFNYTSRSLVRGGQRTVLAIFCVAVGVMAIVALQLVGLMITNAFNSNVRDANGGDIAVRSQNQPFVEKDFPYFDGLKKNGTIENYTPVINAQGFTGANVSLRQTFSVRVVDPQHYPVVTPPTFVNPASGTVAGLLQNKQVIVTQSFIDQYKKKIGDSFDLHTGSRNQGERTVHVKIAGIVTESGVLAQSGSVVLLSIADYKAATIQSVTDTTQASGVASTSGSTPAAQGSPTPAQKTGATGGKQPAGSTPSIQAGTPAQNGASTQSGSGKNTIFYDTINITTTAAQLNQAVKDIQSQFPIATTQTAADALKQQQASIDNIRKFLEISGLMALLIGGVGIVNTMQVLLSRRKTEIAMLKTTGYRRGDLYLLFGIEASMLGLIGGVVGALAAMGVSYLVRNLVVQTFNLNIPYLADGFTIGGGVLIGLATALIFGLLPIVQAANIRPLNVIRDTAEGRSTVSVLLTGLLLIVLSVLFCLLTIVILGNDIRLGIETVYGIFIFLGILSLFFGLVIVLVSRLPVPEQFNPIYLVSIVVLAVLAVLLYQILPVFGALALAAALLGIIVVLLPRTWKATVKMSLRNLGRQRARTTTTMLALFVGIFTIGLILVLGQNLHDQINAIITRTINYNVFVITSGDDTTKLHNNLASIAGLQSDQQHLIVTTSPVSVRGEAVQRLLPKGNNAGPSTTSLGRSGALYYLSGVEGYDVGNNQLPSASTAKIVQGRNLQASDAGTDNVLISNQLADLDPFHVKIGDKIVLTGLDQVSTRSLTVVGVYHSASLGGNLEPLLGTRDTALALSPGGVNQAVFYMKIDPKKLNQATDIIGTTVPHAFVLNLASITDFINQLLNDILLTLTTIASLSLVAGLVIIANAVALAMLERRRELGILKSVGYTSGTILSEVLLENGLVGGIGAIMAMILVTIVMYVLGVYVFNSSFNVSGTITIELILGSALMAMVAAALVAWNAVRVRPLEVLRYE